MDFEETTETSETAKKKKGKGKIILVLILIMVLTAGTIIGFHFYQQSVNFLVTDNARITTNLATIMPSVTGILENYTIREGSIVSENEILGWVENMETFRSPFDGIVVRSYASQNQVVWPMEPIAVIADINNLHIQANIEETYITRIHRGQNVIVTLDAFGNQQFNGYVSEIGRVTDAEISGTALFFNTGGNFTKVTQLIPVKINITDDINLANLIGLNARVRISLNEPVSEITRATNNTENTHRRSVYTISGLVIERINIQVGDTVSAGQILCVFDDMDISHEVNIAQSSLRMAQVHLEAAGHNHQVISGLYNARAVARDELRQAEFALQSAHASLAQAQAMLNAANAAMERSIIRSPIDGVVTAIFAREGEIGMGLLFVIEDVEN
ncbi:MAG: efflux RND transporter periplasmic adaptor subunit [Treponema sp.]|jgi:multidrug resistance efflux pump|nr:efflux RND transporter periplasmic adaptor subunit [Treponema sp.]